MERAFHDTILGEAGAASNLAKSSFFEFPGVGHGASAAAGCPQEMVVAFPADPVAVPAEQLTMELAAFTGDTSAGPQVLTLTIIHQALRQRPRDGQSSL